MLLDEFTYRKALLTQERVGYNMIGRLGDPGRNVAALTAYFAVQAGPGDHCEIGTLWGGSAIVTALLKQQFGIAGKVVCIDPLDGYYLGVTAKTEHDKLNIPNVELQVPVDRATLEENLKRFGVFDLVEIVQARSVPFPEELYCRQFVSALIDGDHWGPVPFTDFLNLRNQTGKYIMLDNVPDDSPYGMEGVGKARELIAENFRWQWNEVYQDGAFLVLEKCHARCD